MAVNFETLFFLRVPFCFALFLNGDDVSAIGRDGRVVGAVVAVIVVAVIAVTGIDVVVHGADLADMVLSDS
ncbi:MAG: hypothetical protein P8104_05695 [Gammaproteobacteria bacterium]